jgi:DNA-binding cell septation regulator SpoVG
MACSWVFVTFLLRPVTCMGPAMKVINMRKVQKPQGRTRAFFTLETENFLIHDCRLVETDSGRLVAHLPFKTYDAGGRRGIYEPVVEFKDLDYLNWITEEALKVYNARF